MIQAWIADAAGARVATLAEAQAAAAAGAARAWIDLDGESEAVAREALGAVGVHPLVLDDMVVEINRPKVDDYGRYLYMVVHSARWERDEPRPSMRELDIVLSDHLLVTYHDGSTRSVEAAAALLPRRPELLASCPARLLHYLLDVLVDNYLPIMDRLSEDVDALEEDVFHGEGQEVYERIVRIKRGIATMRRIVGPQRDTVLALTRDEFAAIPAEMRPYLRDVYDRLARVADLLDSFRDEVAGLLELQVSVVSNRMNEVIKRLTVIATIFMPLTVVTGYYGMNFKLAEYEYAHGEWFVLAVLLLTAVATWAYLRWKRWD